MADIIIEGLNISAMSRNLKKLTALVIDHEKTIKLLQKDQRLCFERIDDAKTPSERAYSEGGFFDALLKGKNNGDNDPLQAGRQRGGCERQPLSGVAQSSPPGRPQGLRQPRGSR